MKKIGLSLSAFLFLLNFSIQADERIRTVDQLFGEGYLPAEYYAEQPQSSFKPFSLKAHSLQWPVTFNSNEGTIGNTMVQYQPFDNPPYWHGGCDLLNSTDTPVIAPVSGKLVGGHYSYATQPDGSMKKFWKPWPEQGEATYFELAIITDDGIRYELHHIDRDRLSKSIVDRLNKPGSMVLAGEEMGFAVDSFAGMNYTHVHYNLVMPDGTRINPEWVSQMIPDTDAPQLIGKYAVLKSGSVLDLAKSNPTEAVSEIILNVDDQVDHQTHQHPAVYFEVTYQDQGEAKTQIVWDFREKLLTQDKKFPALSSFFLYQLKVPGGKTLKTTGGYGEGTSLIRIPVSPTWHGPVLIRWEDTASQSGQTAVQLP